MANGPAFGVRRVEFEHDPAELDVVARSKPCASSAAITPMRRRRCSTRAIASSFSMSWRAIRRSTAAPVTRNSPAPSRSTSKAGSPPGGRPGTPRPRPRPPPPPRPRRAAARGAAAPARGSRGPARGAGGDEHRHLLAHPASPRLSGGVGLLGRHEVGLGEREDARERGEPRVVLGQLALDHREVRLGLAPVEWRQVEDVHEQPRALDMGEEVVAQAGAVAGALDQAGDVGDDELAVVGLERAEHRLERGERVGGDLRLARVTARAARSCPRWAGRRGPRRRAA